MNLDELIYQLAKLKTSGLGKNEVVMRDYDNRDPEDPYCDIDAIIVDKDGRVVLE
jgi:hypothetical protein